MEEVKDKKADMKKDDSSSSSEKTSMPNAGGMMGMIVTVVVVIVALAIIAAGVILLAGGDSYDGAEAPNDFITYNENGLSLGYPSEGWELSDTFGVTLTPTDTDLESIVTVSTFSELTGDDITVDDLDDMECSAFEDNFDDVEGVDLKEITGVEMLNSKGCVIVTETESDDVSGTVLTYFVANEDKDLIANLTAAYADGEDTKDDVLDIVRSFEFTEMMDEEGEDTEE